MKVCTKCGALTDAFAKNRHFADGLQKWCRECFCAYRAANADRISSQKKADYAENGVQIRERVKAYREARTSVIAARKSAYKLANREKVAAKDRAYYLANKAAFLSRVHSRRKQLVGAPGFTAADVRELMALQRGRCAACYEKLLRFEVDHIDPLARGGEHSRRNIQLLCRTCNRQKTSKHPVDFMQSRGFLL